MTFENGVKDQRVKDIFSSIGSELLLNGFGDDERSRTFLSLWKNRDAEDPAI